MSKKVIIVIIALIAIGSVGATLAYKKIKQYSVAKDYEQAKILFELSVNTDNEDLKFRYRNTISKLAPKTEIGYFSKAFLLEQQNLLDMDDVLLCYNKAIEANPEFFYAYINRAAVYLHKGEYELAIADATEAIELSPDSVEAHINRSEAYRALGKVTKADADLVQAEKLQGQKSTIDEAGLANPASVYCLEIGGTLEMRENEAGTYGVCIFDSGRECEEWSLFRGDCDPNTAVVE